MDSKKFREMAEELESLPCPEGTDATEWRQYCGRMARVASKEAEYLDMITASPRTMWEGPVRERVWRRITDPVKLAKKVAEFELVIRLATALGAVLKPRRERVWGVARGWAESDAEVCACALGEIRETGGFTVSVPAD